MGVLMVLMGTVMMFHIHLPTVGRAIGGAIARAYARRQERRLAHMDELQQLEFREKQQQKELRRLERALANEPPGPGPGADLIESASGKNHRSARAEPAKPNRVAVTPTPAAAPAAAPELPAPPPAPPPRSPSKPRTQPSAATDSGKKEAREALPEVNAVETPPGGFQFPPLSLLAEVPISGPGEITAAHIDGAKVLTETLSEFGIETTCTHVESGPVVTRYQLLPAAGVRLEKISNLSNNIALAMKAESVRVQAPIPGKGVVGVEVPNIKTNAVFLREVIESETWRTTKAALPLAIGKDVGGRVLVSDLSEMPHLLIAGATGSGKTVCMNSLLAGLLMTRSPAELKLMLVDPKIVEFASYRELPHLVVPVITDAKKVSLGLRWCITEMENRYKLFGKAGVRNIKAFNARPIIRQPELFEGAAVEGAPSEPAIPDRLPYIVVVVDELADLMLVAQAEIENHIARLAQLSRAVGIHMILATQRPSVNVITGTIKANFPARISFQVAQKNDSRTILDAGGADKLLGKGDMLFLPPGLGRLVRAQGCMTTDAEVHAIADHWRAQGAPSYEMSIKEKLEKKSADLPDMEEDDELIEQSVEVIRQTRRASTSSLQRRLRIGYTRAARIMDLLEERGIIGPAQGSDPREILIDLDGDIPQNETRDGDESDEPPDRAI
ncbi:MAG: DNA translocase FtsK [Kiritimatiellae bacterium]|nr:DNA translocase FtsK [Kiritimatiellia bacterium]